MQSRCGLKGRGEIWVEDILNLGVSWVYSSVVIQCIQLFSYCVMVYLTESKEKQFFVIFSFWYCDKQQLKDYFLSKGMENSRQISIEFMSSWSVSIPLHIHAYICIAPDAGWVCFLQFWIFCYLVSKKLGKELFISRFWYFKN